MEVDDILKYLKSSNLAQTGHGLDVLELDDIVRHISSELEINTVAIAGMNKLSSARLKLAREAVESIVWEVLENAKKFHPKRSPSIQVFVFLMKSREVGVWFGDNGRTLSPEQLAQVWTPYYQGEKSFTGEISGMGLGLPMVASLIWGAGGRCRMYNRPGEPGVIVELIIPTEESEPEATHEMSRHQQLAAG